MTVQVAASGVVQAQPVPLQQVFAMTGGDLLALYYVGTSLSYATSSDGGATWTARGLVTYAFDQTFDVGFLGSDGASVFIASFNGYGSVSVDQCAYSATTHTLSAGTSLLYASMPPPFAMAGTYLHGVLHIAALSSYGIGIWHPGLVSNVFDFISYPNTPSAVDGLSLLDGPSGAMYVSVANRTAGAIQLYPYLATSTGYVTGGTWEKVYAYTASGLRHQIDLDSGNLVDVLLNDNGAIKAVRRTGTNTYSLPYALATGAQVGVPPAHIVLPGSMLLALYQSAATPAGIFAVVRTSSWSAPYLVWPGETFGQGQPAASLRSTVPTAPVIYADLAGGVRYGTVSAGVAPAAPTGIAPSGPVGSVTPTISWIYNDAAPNDLQGGFQAQVQHVVAGVATQDWDSADVAGAASSVVYGAVGTAAALSYGTTYQVRVRNRDSLTSGGAGTYGPWSPWTSFTPTVAGSVAILAVTTTTHTCSATPCTIDQSTFRTQIVWTQSSDRPAGAVQQELLLDGAVVASTGWLTVDISSASTFNFPAWSPAGLVNTTTYTLRVSARMTGTAIVSVASLWTLTLDYPPPAAVTGVTATPDALHGQVEVLWTGGGGTGVLVERALTDALWLRQNPSGWETIYTGAPLTGLYDFPPVGKPVTYRVTTLSETGGLSAAVASPTVTLGYQAGRNGIWFVSVNDPTLRFAFGLPDSWDSTKFTLQEEVTQWVPMGRQFEMESWGLANWWDTTKFVYRVPYTLSGAGVSIDGHDVRAAVITAATRRAVCHYRDPLGRIKFLTIHSLEEGVAEPTILLFSCELREKQNPDPSGLPFTVPV